MSDVGEGDAPLCEAFRPALLGALQKLGIALDAGQVERLEQHFELLLEANRQFNLTRITDPQEAAVKLYADSAATIAWSRTVDTPITRVLDVGTGAGLPAVVLATLAPHWQVTALEATGKKARFVDAARQSLHLDNLTVIHAHSAHWRSDSRFDLAVFKAIGSIADCLALARPHLRRGGYAAIHKSPHLPAEELHAGESARLGFSTLPSWTCQLPLASGTLGLRLCLYWRGERQM